MKFDWKYVYLEILRTWSHYHRSREMQARTIRVTIVFTDIEHHSATCILHHSMDCQYKCKDEAHNL